MINRFVDYLFRNQVIFALFLITFGWFVYQTRGILVLFFLAYILMSALMPAVDYLKKQGLPRILAVFIPFISVIILIFALIIPLVPFFADQIKSLFTHFPDYMKVTANIIGIDFNANQLKSYIGSEINTIGSNAITITTRIFGGIFAIFTVAIVSFYLLFYHEQFKHWFARRFAPEYRDKVRRTLEKVNYKLGAWLRGQVTLSFSIGIVTYFALLILHIPFALPLALIAGLLEILPTLGPILAALPALVVAFTISPSMTIVVAITYFFIQTLENHILVPKIMQHAVGLNPVIVIFAITIGANLMGIAGALISIPFVSLIIVLYQSINDVFNEEDKEE